MDVQWSLLNESLLEYVKKGQWGAYTRTRNELAEIHKKEGRLKDALRMYLGVCYLDLNEPMNMMVNEEGDVIESEYNMPFEPEIANLPPRLIKSTKKLIEELGLERGEIKDIYLDFAYRMKKSTGAPLKPQDCFGKIEEVIYKQ